MASTEKWIPVTERLPEQSMVYLITGTFHGTELIVDVSYFDAYNKQWFWEIEGDAKAIQALNPKVIAWREKPAPYQP